MTLVLEPSTSAMLDAFTETRRASLSLCAPLTPEDMMVQSCEEASPAKWHLAHTTWFFETFVLAEFLSGYRPFHPDFHWLFNSYYNALSDQPEKKLRASFSRPALASILEYREHVERELAELGRRGMPDEAERRLILGIHHEQQHQELLCYDIKHALWTNPLHPAYQEGAAAITGGTAGPMQWLEFAGGLHEIGHAGESFAYDNELPRHPEYLQPFALASRTVTCAEYLAFIEDGGYRRSELWLAEGWDTVRNQGWDAPLYWREIDGVRMVYTLRGLIPLASLAATPVCHVSLFEADAYARWAGLRLPSESEWEVAAAEQPVEGNFLESGLLHPAGQSAGNSARDLGGIFGDVWEWTRSPYVGYPGYTAPSGALGEYNGKFMCNQHVLRGGSVVTPRSHIRTTYRNFFPAATRWQVAGFRLAKDLRHTEKR